MDQNRRNKSYTLRHKCTIFDKHKNFWRFFVERQQQQNTPKSCSLRKKKKKKKETGGRTGAVGEILKKKLKVLIPGWYLSLLSLVNAIYHYIIIITIINITLITIMLMTTIIIISHCTMQFTADVRTESTEHGIGGTRWDSGHKQCSEVGNVVMLGVKNLVFACSGQKGYIRTAGRGGSIWRLNGWYCFNSCTQWVRLCSSAVACYLSNSWFGSQDFWKLECLLLNEGIARHRWNVYPL